MNPLRSILVHVDAGSNLRARLDLAAALGRAYSADVSALYAVSPVLAEIALESRFGNVLKELGGVDESRMAAARESVRAASADTGVPIEWHVSRDGPEYATILHALCADLLVLGQHDRAKPRTGVPADFASWVLNGSSKPAIVVPYIGARPAAFTNVLVAWKPTRESARALSGALPLMQRAQSVSIAMDSDTTPAQRELLLGYLRRHGIQAATRMLTSSPTLAGEFILSLAADVGADLLVMGCYGHSRARELVLGGATRTVLESMTVPVLMAH